MNRTLLFDSPFLLGFEHTRMLVERAAKAAAEGYPPYNVEDLNKEIVDAIIEEFKATTRALAANPIGQVIQGRAGAGKCR